MKPIISVVICTYNREDLITGCLDSLAAQTADPDKFEVIVVDNNSSDGTFGMVKNYQKIKYLRLVCETKIGLSHARNRGVAESQGDFIAFLDDDARAESHYIENALNLIDRFDSSINCFGGPIFPFYTTPKPDWFKDKYEVRRDRKEGHFLTEGQTFSGSNMIWKRDILIELGGFNPTFGMIGNQLWGGEEINLIKYLWQVGQPIFYFSPELIVYHWVPPEKLLLDYRIKRIFVTGQSTGVMETSNLNRLHKIEYFFIHLGKTIKFTIRSLIFLTRHSKIQNWIIEEMGSSILEFGKISSCINFIPKIEQRS
mgnify:CR=1 FL=1